MGFLGSHRFFGLSVVDDETYFGGPPRTNGNYLDRFQDRGEGTVV